MLALMRLSPVIPVLTVAGAEDGLAQARALVAGGLPIIEVTLRTAGALAAISAIRQALPQATVGAGTIVEPEQMAPSVAAGAAFLVSPGTTPRLADAAAQAPVPFMPGAATASEAMALRERGFRGLKFFPAEASGGVSWLAALAAPLADLCFCPTGGIDAQKAVRYLALKNVLCVGGSWMVPATTVQSGDYASIEELARAAAAALRAV
ncbi:MAG: bifunctional 4-hydroxy-2-oxoglutarate aldolase/2-dehydro-3-deoxy-phosphogluconate aldolase [Methylobacteriaceae bacterium]|nr:bifunctional 4-hydroxy-2-oxoglutarate aldolase/2-dehydro-3-deoxy-phosphogluconate aldolase [Methylobacteriaceae bacterium]